MVKSYTWFYQHQLSVFPNFSSMILSFMELWLFPWKPHGLSLIMLTYQNGCCSSLSTKNLSQYGGKRLCEAGVLSIIHGK